LQPGPLGSRRARAAAHAAAHGLGAAIGWTGAGTWAEPPPPLDQAVSAVVLEIGIHPGTGVTAARIRVINLGWEKVSVTAPGAVAGAQWSGLAARPTGLDPAESTVPGGTSRDFTAPLTVSCTSPLPLGLDPLIATRSDGQTRSIPLRGAAVELDRLCATGPARGVLRITDIGRDGPRMQVRLTVPGGRSIRVVGIEVGGLALTGRPLPAQVDGQVRSIWLDPPRSCPASWRTLGAPRALDVIIEDPFDQSAGSTRTRISLVTGDDLASWLLDAGCPGDG
ncbi:MAG: hypothetical protein WAL50_12125, partial [Kineosporiaceae bacterium]